jgi:periplasmic protein CpxP/Spy
MLSILGRGALCASAIAILALAGPASAQTTAPPAPADAAAGAHHHHHDPAAMRAHMADHLRAALQLQPNQDGALNAFLDAMHPPGGDKDGRRHDHGMDGGQALTTPERLDKMAAAMDARHARFVQTSAAIKQFYAQLSPSQQKAFDSLHVGHEQGGMAEGRGHGGWGRHGGGPDGGHEMGPGAQPQG